MLFPVASQVARLATTMFSETPSIRHPYSLAVNTRASVGGVQNALYVIEHDQERPPASAELIEFWLSSSDHGNGIRVAFRPVVITLSKARRARPRHTCIIRVLLLASRIRRAQSSSTSD